MTTNDPHNQPLRHRISWPEFDDAVQDITDRIRVNRSRNQMTNDMLIGITCGGLPLMTGVVNRLKNKFNYRLDNLQIATTSAYRPCVKALADQFNNHINTGNGQSRLWLFEDIVDTGNTITNLVSRLLTIGKMDIRPEDIYVCSIVSRIPSNLHYVSSSNAFGIQAQTDITIVAGQQLSFDPNTFIVFPWEVDQ